MRTGPKAHRPGTRCQRWETMQYITAATLILEEHEEVVHVADAGAGAQRFGRVDDVEHGRQRHSQEYELSGQEVPHPPIRAHVCNFGALIAFTFVNLTVIVYFAYRRREIHGAKQIFRNIVLPAVGMAFTILLWVYLSAESTRYGIIWFVIAIAVLLWITRLFRRPLTINMGDAHSA